MTPDDHNTMSAHTTADAGRTVPGEIAGKFYWPSPEYSIPADNLCWHVPPSPNRDFRCTRSFGHPGKCQHEWSPTIKDHSHRTALAAAKGAK